jgi:ABC-type amino acid transport substrate-binding protein
MDYNVFVGTEKSRIMDRMGQLTIYKANQQTDSLAMNKDQSSKGLANLTKGQLIKGTVVGIGDQVTLNFDGQNITTSKDLLGDVSVGDVKTFEVMKATSSEIELKLYGEIVKNGVQSIKIVTQDTDREAMKALKEKAACKQEKENKYQETNKKLENIRSRLTGADCREIEKEGIPIEAYSINGLYAALNRVKARQAIEEEKANDKSQEDHNSSSLALQTIPQRLEGENLPATAENVAAVTKALGMSDCIKKMDDKTMQYLISTSATPSIGNIYKAYFSGSAGATWPLSDDEWNKLQGQVGDILTLAGYESTKENLDSAKWLIENQLPLTEETFTYKKGLEELKGNADQNTILNQLFEGMKAGVRPLEVSLISASGVPGEQIVANVNSISSGAVETAVKNGMELTIRNLAEIQKQLPIQTQGQAEDWKGDSRIEAEAVENTEEISNSDSLNSTALESGTDSSEAGTSDNGSAYDRSGSSYEEIRAKRQLEEIRLKMTADVATQLEKKGFKVEVQELSKVVDALKELEDNYYKEYLREADVEPTPSLLQVFKDTTLSVEQLKNMPSFILGSTLLSQEVQTIPSLLLEGTNLQAKLSKAGEAYETLATVPNGEYGDSIKKAFANMSSMLAEMNIEDTAQNQRAVRILGYNQMEINQESINRVKAYDLQVSTMMDNLHPAVTVRMIKDGLNPMEMTISELNRMIDQIKEEQGITSEEKYSTFLRKLDASGGITSEERKAYIGVYRLLYNVEKSDGAALGAVVKAGQEVTLDHLLTAVQTMKKGKLDAIIDDEFGTLQEITRSKESIAMQLGSLTDKQGSNSSGQGHQDEQELREEYLNRILKQLGTEVTPEILKEISSQGLLTGALNGQNSGNGAGVPPTGLWEMIKDMPVDQLLGQVNQFKGAEENYTDNRIYQEKTEQIRELCRNSELALRFLNDYQVASTPMNIMMANNVLSNGESPIKRLLKLQEEKNEEKSEESLKKTNDLTDKMINKQSMEAAYKELETDAKAALTQAYAEEKLDSWKLAELKTIGQQISFARRLAEKEFYQIPIETEKGITNMNLTILRGETDSGKLSVTAWSNELGNLKANFTLKDKVLKGFISSDSRAGLDQLKNHIKEVEEAAKQSQVTLKQIDFGYLPNSTDNYYYQNPNTEENTMSQADTERILYRVAKALVQSIRAAENSDS